MHLLQLMVLHWQVIITQSPQLTFGGTHSKGLGKHIMINIHHYSITQSSFTALKLFCAPPIHPWVLIRLFFPSFFFVGHAVHKACRILVPPPRIEPGPQQWKCRDAIVGPLENCQMRQNFLSVVCRNASSLFVHEDGNNQEEPSTPSALLLDLKHERKEPTKSTLSCWKPTLPAWRRRQQHPSPSEEAWAAHTV